MRLNQYLGESHQTIEKKARGSTHRVELDMQHTGGRDIGSVSIWTKDGKWIVESAKIFDVPGMIKQGLSKKPKNYNKKQLKMIDQYREMLKKRNTMNKMSDTFLDHSEKMGRFKADMIKSGIDVIELNKQIDDMGRWK